MFVDNEVEELGVATANLGVTRDALTEVAAAAIDELFVTNILFLRADTEVSAIGADVPIALVDSILAAASDAITAGIDVLTAGTVASTIVEDVVLIAGTDDV